MPHPLLTASRALLLAATALSPVGARELPSAPLEVDFGRFSERLVRCSVSAPGQERQLQRCGQLRLEQNFEGVMSVRFSLQPGSERYGREELVFAGILSDDSEPMACRGDGRCRPRFPLAFSVHAISSGLYDQLGLAASLPRARVARGQCRIEAVRATCEATGDGGERWHAQGYFLAVPPPDARAQR